MELRFLTVSLRKWRKISSNYKFKTNIETVHTKLWCYFTNWNMTADSEAICFVICRNKLSFDYWKEVDQWFVYNKTIIYIVKYFFKFVLSSWRMYGASSHRMVICIGELLRPKGIYLWVVINEGNMETWAFQCTTSVLVHRSFLHFFKSQGSIRCVYCMRDLQPFLT